MSKRKKYPSQKRIKELFYYNQETGDVFWIKKTSIYSNIIIGDIAGNRCLDGYNRIQLDGSAYKTGRLIFIYMKGYDPEHDIDHKNRIRHDDRWLNLDHKTRSCNNINRGIMKSNKSGITGVCLFKANNKWKSQIKINKISIFLGYHIDLISAAKARWEAEKKYNFPNCNTTSTAYQYLREHNAL